MKIIFLITFLVITNFVFSQELASIKVQSGEERIDAPVSVSLDGINYNTDKGNLALYEITPSGEKPVPSQIEPGHSARLWFILNGVTKKNSERKYVLKLEEKPETTQPKVSLRRDHKDLSLQMNGKPIFSYRFATTFHPIR